MSTTAQALASWASELTPSDDDLALAHRSLIDTTAVTLAARDSDIGKIAADLPEAARWSAVGHVLDFDDLHIESTAHISVVLVPTVLATGGNARAYLAGAGVMARLGSMLGWSHYSAGWHATCTAGAPAAAVAAGIALGLSASELAHAMALAVPAAGGVQEAFGTLGKSLQVGFAAQAGVRAARLAATGATAAPAALDAWLRLVGGDPARIVLDGPAVPGGLAIKVFPCCYAMQRPIAAVRKVRDQVGMPQRVVVRTPESAVHPLIHDRPTTGLEGKFSLPYAIATALLDSYPDFDSFTDVAVNRPDAQAMLHRVQLETAPGGDGLLDGAVAIDFEGHTGAPVHTTLNLPPGAPQRPPTSAELDAKLAACGAGVPELLADVSWDSGAELLRHVFPGQRAASVS